MEEKEEDVWNVLEQDEDNNRYQPLLLYKTNHISNAKLLMYDMKVSQDVINCTRMWTYEDKTTLNAIIANLICCLKKESRLVYPRDKYMKMESKRGLTVHKIKKAVDWLEDNGYIINSVGQANEDIERRISSYMTATDKFKELWNEEVKMESQLQYVDQLGTLELRDGEKVVTVFRSNSGLRRMSKVVRDLNVLNESHIIRDRNGDIMTNIYCRIFNETFDHGGRFYRADVLGLQHKVGDLYGRWHITIDDSNVCEIDYGNLHFLIASELNGIDRDNLPTDVYSGMIPDENNSVDRGVVKLAVNVMLNSKDYKGARGAVQRHINKLSKEDKEQYTLGNGSDVLDMVFSAYPQFSDILCKSESYGLVLQNHDSNLASDVVEVFIEKGYPILIVHDSFITKVEHMNLLCDTMGDCYRKRFNSTLPVPVGAAWKELDGTIMQRKMSV